MTTRSAPLLLLPTARLVPFELQLEFGPIASAVVPLGSKPALVHIAGPYLDQGHDVLAAVGDGAATVAECIAHAGVKVRTVDVGRTEHLGDTVLRALESLEKLPDQLVIHFADTLVGDVLRGDDVVCFARLKNPYRWTCFRAGADGEIESIVDKHQEKGEDDEFETMVGVFRIGRPLAFLDALRRACIAPSAVLDPFYQALQSYFNQLPRGKRVLQEVRQWSDLGHLDTYYQAKQSYWMNKRFFNRIDIDNRRGIIRKTSSEGGKLVNEINWYLKLPKQLQHLSPRVLGFNRDPFDPSLEIEFYGYPSLGDMYLFGQYDPDVWVQVFSAIDDAIGAMQAHRVHAQRSGAFEGAMREMYAGKTRKRLDAMDQSSGDFAPFFAPRVHVNGADVMGLERVFAIFDDVARRVGLYQQSFFTVIHGDLCMSNILFDRRNACIRMIDPRGSFGDYDIYGDPRYDLAKLAHSFLGDYDFLVNDMFQCSFHGREFRYRPHRTPRHTALQGMFDRWLRRRAGDAYEQVRLIESLLFLSMVPLHRDRPLSQRAFLAQGLTTFTDVAARAGVR